VAATYAQVWWPAATEVVYPEYREPVWDPTVDNRTDEHPDAPFGGFVDPDTRQPLPTWEQALDALDADEHARPRHLVRFGERFDVQGVLAGSPQAEQCVGYLVKYLVKDLGDDLSPARDDHDDGNDDAAREGLTPVNTSASADAKASSARRAAHVARLVEALRYEPCSPSCPNWLRYGIQPNHPRPTMRAGCCRAKAHKPTHLGYGGRRVLVSRKWTAQDLADHRYERRAHVLAILGRNPDGTPIHGNDTAGDSSATSSGRNDGSELVWERAQPTDPDVDPLPRRILRNIAHATSCRAEYRTARDARPPSDRAAPLDTDPSAPAA
jgi:hypothetical protein